METKIYLQLVPTDETRLRIQSLSAELRSSVSGIPTNPEKWHVTILHFGGAEHVFHDIRRELPTLGKTVFEKHLGNYLEAARHTLPGAMTLEPTGVAIFGINRSVAGIEFSPNDQIAKSHKQAVHDLKIFLENCGIQNSENFMRSSINFRWALELRPHITLLRGVKNPNLINIQFDMSPMSFKPGEIHGI